MNPLIIYEGIKIAWNKKHILIPLLIIIFLIPIYIVYILASITMFTTPNLSKEKYNEIEDIKISYLAKKNIYINTNDLIALISIKNNNDIYNVDKLTIVNTIDLFLIKDKTYNVKSIETVLKENSIDKERFLIYKKTTEDIFKNKNSNFVKLTNGNELQKNFINNVANASLYDHSGVFHSITIAQAILESNWGKSNLTSSYNNLFGIKTSFDWTGKSITFPTQEFIGGVWITINDNFRSYENFNESILDHSNFLLQNSRYTSSGVFNSKNYIEQARAIQKAGYATDPNYAEKLIELIEKYGLSIFDLDKNVSDIIKLTIPILDRPYLLGGKYFKKDIPPEDVFFDCSGYIDWIYLNINDKALSSGSSRIGAGTLMQYYNCQAISYEELQIGDLGFYQIPSDIDDTYNHVGIFVGRNSEGYPIFAHAGGNPWNRIVITSNTLGKIESEKGDFGYTVITDEKKSNFKYFMKAK